MARILNDGTGALSGLIGPVIASSWKGTRYLKHKGSTSKKPRTEKQLQHQAQIALVSRFVYSMKELLDKSFIRFAVNKTGTNAAFSYIFKNCISCDLPALAINYPLVLVSRGDLPNAINPVATVNGVDGLQFKWEDNSGKGQAKATDKAVGLIHCPELNISVYTNGTDTRQSCTANLSMAEKPHFVGKTVETWLVFFSPDGREVADSVYTGRVDIL